MTYRCYYGIILSEIFLNCFRLRRRLNYYQMGQIFRLPFRAGNVPVQIRLSNCLRIADSLCTASGFSRTLLTFSVCRKTSIVRYQKWGLGRSPKQGEGGSPTLSPFPGEGVWG